MHKEAAINVTGLRKAAVLMVRLGAEKSAPVLAAMRDAEVELIMAEIAQLDTIDPDLADAVMTEFHQLVLAREYESRGGLAVATDLLEASVGAEKAREITERLNAALSGMPFKFLRGADPRQLVSYLQDEHPQTVALVLSHLPPDEAAVIVGLLEPALAGDVAHRVAIMDRPSPDAIRLVESVLESKLSAVLAPTAVSSDIGGVLMLVDIINQSDRSTERQILEGLDAELAEQVRALMFLFEDIVTLEDKAVQLVLRQTEVSDLATALKGASEAVRQTILRNMSERAGETLLEEIELLGPTRLKTVEEAQAKVVRVIRELEESGQVVVQRGSDQEYVD